MATIQSSIELQDNFSNVLNNIVRSVNLALSSMHDMQQSMSASIDTSSLESAKEEINAAQVALDEMNASAQNLDVSRGEASFSRLAQEAQKTQSYIRNDTAEQQRFNTEIQNGSNYAGNLSGNLMKSVAGFAAVTMAIKKTVGFISDSMDAYDTQLNAETQLMSVLANTMSEDAVQNYMLEVGADTSDATSAINSISSDVDNVQVGVDVQTAALQSEYDKILDKAEEIQSSGIYSDEAMIAGAAELATYFSDADAITMMMDTLSDYAVGMTGGGEVDSTAMVDYATNLGKIMTGSYDAMTKKGFEFTDAQKAIIEGTATEQQIVETLGEEYLDCSDDMQAAAAITQVIDESWAGLYQTMSDTPEGKIIQMTNAWGDMKEMIGGQLYPYVTLFVDAINNNWPTIQAVVNGIVSALQVLMGVLSKVMNVAMKVAQVIVNNWSWIKPIILGVAAALGIYVGYLVATKVAELASAASKGIMALATAAHSAFTKADTAAINENDAALGTQIGTEIADTAAKKADTTATAAQEAVTKTTTEAQNGLNASLLACPLTWIIVLVIALVVALVLVCNKIADMTGIANTGFGIITGGVNVVIQFFKNLGLTVANIALGIGNSISALANNMMTAFHNAILSIQSWFYGLLSTALSVVEGICAALNKLPFVNFDYSGITSMADDYAQKAADAAASKGEYQSISDAFNEGYSTFDTFGEGWASDAFDAGASWGDGVMDKISNFSFSDAFGVEDLEGVTAEDYTTFMTDDLTDSMMDALAGSGVGDNLDSIAGSAGDIADSLDITSEELKYMRDIAEQETVNRFTTAEINIEQTNNNNVSGGMDLDGVVNGLTDAVNEAIDIVTEGVHT